MGGVFGQPKSIRMDECGEWDHEIWTDVRLERRTELRFQGVGAYPWIPERRSVLARGIYNRWMADGRFASNQILSDLGTLISAGGYTAYQMVLRFQPSGSFWVG